MKIGLFTDTYYPQVNGVANSVYTLRKNLEKQGHEIYVFTTSNGLLMKGDRSNNLYCAPSIPAVSENRFAVFYGAKWGKIIKDAQFDLIHTHTEFSLGLLGRFMARKHKIPHVHTYHTIYEDYTHHIVKVHRLEPIARRAARKMSSFYCNSANYLIVPTEKIETLLKSYGVSREIHVIPTGIELKKYYPQTHSAEDVVALKKELGLEDHHKVILFVGRVAKEKNISELLINLQEYLHNNPHIYFLLVGDGAEKDALIALCKKLSLDNQVKFLGKKPWDTIGRYYQLGDIFISASQSETQGITYVEALAAGLPVVAKEDPCLENVVNHGENGYLFQTKSQFLSYVEELLQNEDKRKIMAENAKTSAERFSEEAFGDNMTKLYEHVIGSS